MDKSYENEPTNIATAKANRESNASLWTPRDALIVALRDIDSGKRSYTSIVICCVDDNDDNENLKFNHYVAGAGLLKVLGLISVISDNVLKETA